MLGTKSGRPAAVAVEWLVDTGADLSAVRKSVGASFDTVPVGLTASPTTGGGGIQVVTGLSAEFASEDAFGIGHTQQVATYMGIKSQDAGSNVLGMDALAAVGATVFWDPASGQGTLTA